MEILLLLHILHVLTLLFSASQLYTTASIFDFIVTHEKIYTLPDEKALIEPWLVYPYHAVTLCTFLLALVFVVAKTYPYTLSKQSTLYFYIFPLVHCLILCVCAATNVFCSVTAVSTALEVAKYVDHANPPEFQDACIWYFLRLRMSAIFFGMTALMNAAVCVVTYFGIQKDYSFSKLSVISA